MVAEVVYAVPNDAQREELLNADDIRGRIAIINRGGNVAMVDKVVRAQKAGAVGVLLVDQGSCDDGFHDCGPRAGSVREGGFAPHDGFALWKDVRIPSLLITAEMGARVRSLMPLEEIQLPGDLGRQLVEAFVV